MSENRPLGNVVSHAFHRALEKRPPITNEQVWAAAADAVRDVVLRDAGRTASAEWRTMETAPKDGTPFLAYVPIEPGLGDGDTAEGDLPIVWWEARGRWTDDRDLPKAPKPTCWMPLPGKLGHG